jgi:hypothetical protein
MLRNRNDPGLVLPLILQHTHGLTGWCVRGAWRLCFSSGHPAFGAHPASHTLPACPHRRACSRASA